MSPQELEVALEEERRLRIDTEDRFRRLSADFQEFASRIAHDLREPLRTVSSYTQLLASRFGDPTDEDATLFLQYIRDAVERAQALLAAVVEYSSIEAENRRPVTVDMNAVFVEAARRAGRQEAYRREALPRVIGEFDLLVNVLRHLFTNAVKFAGRSDPSVEVSSRRQNDDWIISVHDNGPGIDAQHQERAFGLFRRLHGREIPGCGMGLPYCRKAIEVLGGRLWLESAAGAGATFLFTLPAADD